MPAVTSSLECRNQFAKGETFTKSKTVGAQADCMAITRITMNEFNSLSGAHFMTGMCKWMCLHLVRAEI